MTLIDREFIADFFKALGALAFLVALVVLVDTLLNYYQEVFGGVDGGLYWAIAYYVCSLPRTMVESAPLGTGAAILWVVTRKARNNEILAYLAGGISPLRLAVPFFISAAVVSVGALTLNETLAARAERRAEVIERVHIKQKDASTITRNRNIYQKGAGRRFYTIESFDSATDTMNRPLILDLHKGSHVPEWILQAESARLVSGPGLGTSYWEFQHAVVRTLDERGQVQTYREYDYVGEAELDRRMEPQLRTFLGNLDDPAKMNFAELRRYAELLEAQGKEVAEYRTDMHRKIALPLAAIAIALVTCGHVMRARSLGVLLGLGGGLAYMAGYYALLVISVEIGEAGAGLAPALAAWLPNGLYGLLGVVLLARAGN